MSVNNNTLVILKDAGYRQNDKWLVKGVSLEVEKGKIVTLIGPNGSGKSTTAKIALGIFKKIEGEVEKYTNKIGYVPQYGGCFHDLTLIENLKAVGEILIKNQSDRQIKIDNMISKFALDNVREIKAKFLSGGQRRKLVICMALLSDPKILLCDEIFAALDVLTIHMLKEILVNLQNENPKICIVVCEHQARELLSIVDRAMILSNCKIIAEGSPNNLIKNEKAKSQYFGNFFKN